MIVFKRPVTSVNQKSD